MSYSAGTGKPPESEPYYGDLYGLRKAYKGYLKNSLTGGGDNFFAPGGALGSIFQNLFSPGGGGSEDYLGARSALQNVLGGNFQGAYDTAYNQMLPSTMDAIRRGQAGLQEAMGPQGLRFSTDLMGQDSALAGQLLNALSQNSLQAGQNILGTQAQGLGQLFGLLGQGMQLSPAAMLAQFVNQFPPTRQTR